MGRGINTEKAKENHYEIKKNHGVTLLYRTGSRSDRMRQFRDILPGDIRSRTGSGRDLRGCRTEK